MNTLSKDAQAYKLALRIASERLAEISGEDAERLFSEIFDQAARLVTECTPDDDTDERAEEQTHESN